MIGLLIGGSKKWRQVDGGMQPAVRQLVFANLTAHLAALYDGWRPILAVRQDRTGQSWFSTVRQQQSAEVSTCCSKPSSFFHFSVQFPLSPRLACLQAQHVFSHTLGLFVTSHSGISISIFNTQHTLVSRVTKYMRKCRMVKKFAVTGETFN